MVAVAEQQFKSLCRQWRQFRKLSQLDLALAANVSQRHVSWLETGRSTPSREMVIRLSEAMEIPLRERNALIKAAGFAPAYRETQLDEPSMAPVMDALSHVLRHHEPLPAVVVDRLWNVKMQNNAAGMLMSAVASHDDVMDQFAIDGEFNLAMFTLHPQGLRPFIANWDLAAAKFVRRLKSEALASGNPQVQEKFDAFIDLAGLDVDSAPVLPNLLPVLPLELHIHGLELSLFSVISTFGTPQDITTDELRVEAFYPTDSKTEKFFRESTPASSEPN